VDAVNVAGDAGGGSFSIAFSVFIPSIATEDQQRLCRLRRGTWYTRASFRYPVNICRL